MTLSPRGNSTSPLHVAVSGWRLGEASGANRRLMAIIAHTAPLLGDDDRITVLHRPDYAPPDLHPRVQWHAVPIPITTPWRRAAAEQRHLGPALAECGATVLDHALMPLPKIRVPVCATIHDMRSADGLTRWPRWLARWAVRGACKRAARIIVPSEFSAVRVRAVAPGADIHVVHNGVDLPAMPGTGFAGNGYLLLVGHLERRKNVAVVLHALAQIPVAERPGLQLVGRDAGDEVMLRAIVEQLQLGDAVRFRGVVADSEITELHSGARAIVVPSRYEGFGFAALDGLAFGRPTLVADAGSLPEVTGDAAVVLPADDASAWARAIADTAVDPIAAPTARRARAAEFSWSRAARATLEIWRASAQ